MGVDTSAFLSPVWREGIFNDRVVFVTGGAGDICSAQTRALVYLGANAFIIGRNPEKTERVAKDIATVRKGAKVIGVGNIDVRKVEDLTAAADRCVAELGSIDYVIAGAAGNFVVPIAGLSSNGFKTVLEIDTLGTFNTVKATIEHLVKSARKNISPNAANTPPGGRFLAISASFHFTGLPMQSHVAAAKAGVDSIMASVALEYGPRGVTSNVITPGPIEGTEGMSRLSNQDNVAANAVLDASGKPIPPHVKFGMPEIPSGRWGTKRDIADATVFLFSSAADNINGHVLVVDGGAWRRQGMVTGSGMEQDMIYPDFLMGDDEKPRRKSNVDSKL